MNQQEKFEQILRECFRKATGNDIPDDEFKEAAIQKPMSIFFSAMQEAARQAFLEGCIAQQEKSWKYMCDKSLKDKITDLKYGDCVAMQHVVRSTNYSNIAPNPYTTQS